MARPDVRDERKNQILNTAALVFARRGFSQARMDDIVHESGLSKGAIYWYFKSKDEIILALLQRFFDTEMEEIQAILARSDEPVAARLSHYNRLMVASVEKIAAEGLLPLFYEFYALATRQDSARQFICSYFELFHALAANLIRQGVEQGELDAAVEPELTATTLSALYEGIILMWTIDPDTVHLQAQFDSALHTFLWGMQAR